MTDDPADPVRRASRLRRAGDLDGALQILAEVARDPRLDPSTADRAGRLVSKCLGASPDPRVHVRFLGQCTTSWLLPLVTLFAWGEGVAVQATEAEYDNVVQDLMARGSHDADPQIWVLVPWLQRLIASAPQPLADRVDAELQTWRIAWQRIADRSAGRTIQVGYDAPDPGAWGYLLGAKPTDTAASPMVAVAEVNRAIQRELPASAAFVDLGRIAGDLGRRRFYSARRYHWTKQPFSESGTVEVARQLWATVRALRTGPRKVLVLDLDNTLWGGVVGETGPLGIELGESPDGEAFVAFQGLLPRPGGPGHRPWPWPARTTSPTRWSPSRSTPTWSWRAATSPPSRPTGAPRMRRCVACPRR